MRESRSVRNLLGRLNARSADDLDRMATWWEIPLPGQDRSRHVGVLYREMTDIRTARAAWERLDDDARSIVRNLALTESGPLGITEIASLTGLDENATRATAIRLFGVGILAREGDFQELPVGATPRLFLPRELAQVFRRLQDEIDNGDMSTGSLRFLLEGMDDPEIEETARIWGINVIPGLRRRADLVSDVLGQITTPERIERIANSRGRNEQAIYRAMRNSGGGPWPFDQALEMAGVVIPPPSSGENIRISARVRDALAGLETALLVCHTYHRDGTRWLFVPREILNPQEVITNIPLRPMQPLKPDAVAEPTPIPPYAVAWDLLTVLREITERDAPIWTPGEPLSRAWQRRINRRLWLAGEDVPPLGYLGFLFHLAHQAGLVVPATGTVPGGLERGGLRPELSAMVRDWRRLSFAEQTARLQSLWIASDSWVEGREREEIELWGADWRGMRTRLLTAIGSVDHQEWFLLDDFCARLAEQNPDLVGTTFTAASSRAGVGERDQRTAAIAQVIEVEVETALHWFGLVNRQVTSNRQPAVRVQPAAEEMPESEGSVLTADERGLVTLNKPSPLHVWSLSAFADAEQVSPVALYQLRPGSVSRALGAGFDLDQITQYLERQQGASLPDELVKTLREWTVGYRRVRVRRAMILQPDTAEMRESLERVLTGDGYEVLPLPGDDRALLVMLTGTAASGEAAEQELLASLRGHGFAGHLDIRQA